MAALEKFQLDPRLAMCTQALGKLPLCRVGLQLDARFPWLVLVPERPDMREIINLDESDQQQLMREIALCCRALQELYNPDKLNVAALGNQVPQLHIHAIARFKTDEAWPNPVWNCGEAKVYDPQVLTGTGAKLKKLLFRYDRP